jgi:tripartite-type tricarboxylate transporter receptor subunit TctC
METRDCMTQFACRARRSRSRLAVAMFTTVMLALDAGETSGQDYPNKPIRLVTTPAGGGVALSARLVADGLAVPLGHHIIVDNRPQILIGPIVAKASPDGYTLLFAANDFWIAPFLQDNVPWNMAEFSAVSLVVRYPSILVLHPSVAASSVRELIELAKSKPGVLNYASGLAGGPNHLAAELFKYMAGVSIVRIPYTGGGPALTALLAGQVQVLFGSAGSVSPHLKSGRLRALAVTGAQPSALAPGLPTVAAAGLPGYQSIGISGIFAPANTPAKIINRLSQEIARLTNRADVKEKFLSLGAEPVGSSPEEFSAFIKSDMATWGNVIKAAGIRAE